jgi:hypothetical protein
MDILKEAIEKRDKFLKDYPHMQEFQKEIDDILDKTPTHMRKDVVITLLISKLQELQQSLNLLGQSIL